MRLSKLVMITATAAVATMAFISAAPASAVGHKWTAVCLENNLLGCAKRPKHPLLGRLSLSIGSIAYKSAFEIKCTKGSGKSSEVESQQENAFKYTLEELNFSECSGGCTKVKFITPQPMEINMEAEGTESWRLKLNNMKWEFFECTFGVKCKFEGTLNLKVQMDTEGIFTDPEGSTFKLIEGSALLCGSTLKWESGRVRLAWVLNVAAKTIHKPIWIVLAAELVVNS